MDPEQTQGAGFVGDAEKQQLLDMIENIRGKMGDVNTAMFSNENASEQSRLDALKEVFAVMQRAGVDLTDPASVSAFLEKVRGMNPEMAAMFEEALNELLGGEPVDSGAIDDSDIDITDDITPPAVAQAPMGETMNEPNEALPEDIRGPVRPEGI